MDSKRIKARRLVAATLIIVMLICALTGCGTSKEPTAETPNPQTDKPTEPVASPGTNDMPQEKIDYHFAKDNFEVDKDGFPTAPYTYDTPFCETDETLTYWTVVWFPQYIPEEGLDGIDFCIEEQARTGVNIEYITVASEARAENFAVLLAADTLPDIMNQGRAYYPGSELDAIENEYFVNLYNYKDYCPNYLYFIASNKDEDKNLYDQCFLNTSAFGSFVEFSDKILPSYGTVGVRKDWCDKLGINVDDIDTVAEYGELARLFKSQFDAEWPMGLLSDAIDTAGFFTCYDFYTTLSVAYNQTFPNPNVSNGKVEFYYTNDNAKAFVGQLAEWFSEGLCNPDFLSAATSQTGENPALTGKSGIYLMTPSWKQFYDTNATDPDCEWAITKKVNLYDGQVHKLGRTNGLAGYGNSQISAKCANIELAVTWCDWRYSEEGAFLASYGIEGTTWEYNLDGIPEATAFAYENPEGQDFTYLMTIYAFNYFAEHGIKLTGAEYMYPGGSEAFVYFDYFQQYEYDGSYEWPKGVTLTDDQSNEFKTIGADMDTYISENILSFINCSKPMSEWDSYIEGLYTFGYERALNIYQEAYDGYMEKVSERGF